MPITNKGFNSFLVRKMEDNQTVLVNHMSLNPVWPIVFEIIYLPTGKPYKLKVYLYDGSGTVLITDL